MRITIAHLCKWTSIAMQRALRPAHTEERQEGVIIYVPGKDDECRCLMVQKIEVQAAPVSTSLASRKLILNAKTSAGSVEIILSAGEAAILMFDIGHALEQANRLSPEQDGPAAQP